MLISDILAGISFTEDPPGLTAGLDVADITSDSRRVPPGALFFAYRGSDYDSHAAAAELYNKKTIQCIVSEHKIEGVPSVVVENGRCAFALSCANFFRNTDKKMTMIGVTGTNGKTTVTWLLEKIFNTAGIKTVRIGTTGANVAGKMYDLDNTTPSPYEFHRMLAEGYAAGASAAIAEVSSHALDQQRLAGVVFDAAVFTNLSGDHLDYHKDLEAYYRAKRHLFRLSQSRMQLVNTDHSYGQRMYEDSEGKRYSYGRHGEFLSVAEYGMDAGGITAVLVYGGGGYELHSPLVGEYNLENILAAAGTALVLGLDMSAVQKGVAELENVPGRLEKYSAGGISVFVDYAHTDDALRNAITALRKVTGGRIITVFGAGGDRDRTKRPRMGKAAQELSDFVIVTSDNPRTEDPKQIIEDILAGMATVENFHVEADREKAIAFAVRHADCGDTILIAGKGHEDYQIIGATKHPFSDAGFVKMYLNEKMKRSV